MSGFTIQFIFTFCYRSTAINCSALQYVPPLPYKYLILNIKYQHQDLSLPNVTDISRYIQACRASTIYGLPINLRYIYKRVWALVVMVWDVFDSVFINICLIFVPGLTSLLSGHSQYLGQRLLYLIAYFPFLLHFIWLSTFTFTFYCIFSLSPFFG